MSISNAQLNALSRLAAIEIGPDDAPALQAYLNVMMDFVDGLREVDTQGVAPLSHPLDVKQRLRQDIAESPSSVESLKAIAPQFKDHLYLVPKVIL